MNHKSLTGTRPRRAAALAAGLALIGGITLSVTGGGGSADAHGASLSPGSRTYLCWKYSTSDTGEVSPTNAACQAALDKGGATAFYNWFAVLRSDGAGRTEGFVPDGQLCSGGDGGPYDFSGFDLPRADWPFTHVTAGAEMEFSYNAWAAHPGTFRLYVTEDSYDPTEELTWADIEDEPFLEVTDPPLEGDVGTEEGRYVWSGQLPEGKSGRHIVYSVWERSDSEETFYGCSDVVFDGGDGEVEVP